MCRSRTTGLPAVDVLGLAGAGTHPKKGGPFLSMVARTSCAELIGSANIRKFAVWRRATSRRPRPLAWKVSPQMTDQVYRATRKHQSERPAAQAQRHRHHRPSSSWRWPPPLPSRRWSATSRSPSASEMVRTRRPATSSPRSCSGLFAIGYATMAKHITATGAFYGYISHGLGRVVGFGQRRDHHDGLHRVRGFADRHLLAISSRISPRRSSPSTCPGWCPRS